MMAKGWQRDSWEKRGFLHFSCAENECKKLEFMKSKRKNIPSHKNNNKYLLSIMFVVNSRVIDFVLLIYIEDKQIKSWFVKIICGCQLFPRKAMTERLSHDV